MRRFGNKHITTMTAVGLLILLTAGLRPVWAGPQEAARKVSAHNKAEQQGAVISKPSPPLADHGPGFQGVAFSLDRARVDQSINLKTAVLVKPLKAANFYVAFAASAPLIKNSSASNTDLYGADASMEWQKDFQAPHGQQGADTGSDWLVMADWPQAGRLSSADRAMMLSRLPEMIAGGGWNSKMELIFLPADQWTVRAILSMAHDAQEYRKSLSAREAHSARVGIAIDVDYQMFKSMALGFDYGHYRYGRTLKDATGDAETSPDASKADGPVRSDAFTARLTIRF